jgi:hypothetical protein
MTEREIKDAEQLFCREEEDEKYNIILTNRRQMNELMRMKREVKNNEL